MGYLEEAITEWFGERCMEHVDGCPACDAWAEYDAMVAPAVSAGDVELDALVARLRGWDHCWPARWLEAAVKEAADAITALRAKRAPAEVQVKALVWYTCVFAGQPAASADTSFGPWMVVAYSGRDGRWAYTDPAGNDSEDDWATRAECEAAAQADHDARIRAEMAGGEA